MTFCLGIRVEEGLVGIADTRVTSGSECITARKVSVYQYRGLPLFLMTSGLRSVRDKAVTYFEDELEKDENVVGEDGSDKLYHVVNLFAKQVRRVAAEDKEILEDAGLSFNFHALIGGQLRDDKQHKLFLMYPQGNWVEIGKGTPYSIIGASGYGKPILDRALQYTDPMRFALKVGVLSFDSTRISAADVDPPIDLVLYRKDSGTMVEHRFETADVAALTLWWEQRLRTSIRNMPAELIDQVIAKVPGAYLPDLPLEQAANEPHPTTTNQPSEHPPKPVAPTT